MELAGSKNSNCNVDLANLTQMMFFPQSAIELLIAEHFLDTSGPDKYSDLFHGVLRTDDIKLRRALNEHSFDLSSKHRRCLDTKSVIHLVTVEHNSNFEVLLGFPKVSFTEITDTVD